MYNLPQMIYCLILLRMIKLHYHCAFIQSQFLSSSYQKLVVVNIFSENTLRFLFLVRQIR